MGYTCTLAQLEEMFGVLISHQHTDEKGHTIVYVKKAILPNRPQQEYAEYHFDENNVLKYFL